MENLGETFIKGKVVNLDTTDVVELENYLKDIQDNKFDYRKKLNSFIEKIYS